MIAEPFMKWRERVGERKGLQRGVELVLDNPEIKAHLEQNPELREQVRKDVEAALKDRELKRD